MNKVRVNICGKNYNLSTDNDEECIINLAAKLNDDINALLTAHPSLGVQSAAVICALSAYEERSRTEDSIDNLRLQIKEYADEAARSRDDRDKAVIEADRLRSKLDSLENSNTPSYSAEEDAEQLVLENTITPAVTIPVKEPEMRDAAPPGNSAAQSKNNRGKRKKH